MNYSDRQRNSAAVLKEIVGRMSLCVAAIIIAAFISKWLVNKHKYFISQDAAIVAVAIVASIFPLWPAYAIYRSFPKIYRFSVITARQTDKSVLVLIIAPLNCILFMLWTKLCIIRFFDIMDNFFNRDQIKPLIAAISGEFGFMLIISIAFAQFVAFLRGTKFDRPY